MNNYRLAVDTYTWDRQTGYVCQCYTQNMPEELEPECTEKTVSQEDMLLYVARNKSAHAADWMIINSNKPQFLNALADVINAREGREATYQPNPQMALYNDAEVVDEYGLPDVFSSLSCFNPEHTNTFIIGRKSA